MLPKPTRDKQQNTPYMVIEPVQVKLAGLTLEGENSEGKTVLQEPQPVKEGETTGITVTATVVKSVGSASKFELLPNDGFDYTIEAQADGPGACAKIFCAEFPVKITSYEDDGNGHSSSFDTSYYSTTSTEMFNVSDSPEILSDIEEQPMRKVRPPMYTTPEILAMKKDFKEKAIVGKMHFKKDQMMKTKAEERKKHLEVVAARRHQIEKERLLSFFQKKTDSNTSPGSVKPETPLPDSRRGKLPLQSSAVTDASKPSKRTAAAASASRSLPLPKQPGTNKTSTLSTNKASRSLPLPKQPGISKTSTLSTNKASRSLPLPKQPGTSKTSTLSTKPSQAGKPQLPKPMKK